MLEDIKKRLQSLGYTLKDTEDDWIITFVEEKVRNQVLTFCNLSAMPEKLNKVFIDMIAGEFLLNKKNAGRLNIENGFDVDVAIKQIKEGDMSLTFAIGEGSQTLEQKLDSLINHLMSGGKSQLTAYRKMRW